MIPAAFISTALSAATMQATAGALTAKPRSLSTGPGAGPAARTSRGSLEPWTAMATFPADGSASTFGYQHSKLQISESISESMICVTDMPRGFSRAAPIWQSAKNGSGIPISQPHNDISTPSPKPAMPHWTHSAESVTEAEGNRRESTDAPAGAVCDRGDRDRGERECAGAQLRGAVRVGGASPADRVAGHVVAGGDRRVPGRW